MKWYLSVILGLAIVSCASTEDTPIGATDDGASAKEPTSIMDVFGIGPSTDAPAPEELADYPFGSADNPVRADMPSGQREYLDRLRCPGGDAPTYARIGNMGVGPYGTIIDGY